MREVRAGQFYRHFKGGTYQTLAVAEHTETGERLVVYQALYGDFRVYARPYDMFVSEVDREKYPQAEQRYRFEEIEPQSARQEREGSIEPKGSAPERETMTAQTSEGRETGSENSAAKPEGHTYAEDEVNPILLEFLDADTLEEKMHILIRYRNQMDESLLNSIAIALDVVVEKKGVQEKYDEILTCISTMKRFETTRLR
ncbi:MAG: DUF1653 domain-containing protein [Lachnospiraceae bacterium]|nr:DUF1653 domain-containing protein [Lachnospiraceae bacterium]